MGPVPDALVNGQRLARQGLRHLLGVLAGLTPERGELAHERMFA